MFHNAIPALILSVGLLHGGPGWQGGAPRAFAPPPGAFGVPVAAGGCLSSGEARAAVQSGQAIEFSSVLSQIRSVVGGQVISTTLCDADGQLVYYVDVLSSGKVTHLKVDARTGSISQ